MRCSQQRDKTLMADAAKEAFNIRVADPVHFPRGEMIPPRVSTRPSWR